MLQTVQASPDLRGGAGQGPRCGPAPGRGEVHAGRRIIGTQQWFLRSQQTIRPRPF